MNIKCRERKKTFPVVSWWEGRKLVGHVLQGEQDFVPGGGAREGSVGGWFFFPPFQVERNFKMVAEPRRKVVIATKV